MVNDLNIDYDEQDLRQLEKDISSKIGRINESSGGPSSVL